MGMIAIAGGEEGRMCYCEKCGKALPERKDEYKIDEEQRKKTVCVECFHKHYTQVRLKMTPRP